MVFSKKKRVTILCTVILPIALLLVVYFIPYTEEKIYTISYPLQDVITQIRTPANWADWNPDIKKDCFLDSASCDFVTNYAKHEFSVLTPHKKISINEKNPTTFEIETVQNNLQTSRAFVNIVAHQATMDSTILQCLFRVSLLRWIIYNVRGIENELDPLSGLKKFMETPILYYKHPIEIRRVIDTIVLVTRKKVHINKMLDVLPVMFNQLNTNADSNHLSVLQPPMITFSMEGKDSALVTTMYAVNKSLPFSKNGLSTFRMPKNGRMLVGKFKGKFSDRKLVYESMQRYVADKKLSVLVTSYEKYTNGALPVSSNSEIELEVYFPIY